MIENRIRKYIPYKAAYESIDMSVALTLLNKSADWHTMILGGKEVVLVLQNYLERVHGISVDVVVNDTDFASVKDECVGKSKWIIFNLYRGNNNSEYKILLDYLISECIDLEYKIIDMSAYIYDLFYVSFVSYFISNREILLSNEYIWGDDISRKVYTEYIMSFLEGRNYCGEVLDESTKYFGLSNSELFEFSSNKSWINVGASTGDTIFWSIYNGIAFKKIYAIEGEKNALAIMKANLELVNIQNVNIIPKYCGMKLSDYKLDDINDDVILINMDIEGAEKEALLSGRKLIAKYKPILAICAYHLADDLIEIPKLIKSIDNSYKFFLRKYTSGAGRHYHAIHRVNELVLYAISEDR